MLLDEALDCSLLLCKWHITTDGSVTARLLDIVLEPLACRNYIEELTQSQSWLL